MIDILIPTFNRALFLRKNLLILDAQIRESKLSSVFRILVSDNCSTDETEDVLGSIKSQISVELLTYKQDKNIGLEPNALFLLDQAKSEYVMYLGDDDYIPDGYLDFVVKCIKEDDVACVIPGFSGLYPDNAIKPARTASFDIRKYSAGLGTVCRISNFGHQLSGLVTKREGLYKEYMKRCEYRNIYPFVFFITYSMLRGSTYYAPKYQVLVSQGNSKDWRYDNSGLLVDIFRNYKIAFPDERFKAVIASIAFAKIQSWRLRVGVNPINASKAFIHIMSSREIDPIIKFSLLLVYPYCYFEKLVKGVRSKLVSR